MPANQLHRFFQCQVFLLQQLRAQCRTANTEKKLVTQDVVHIAKLAVHSLQPQTWHELIIRLLRRYRHVAEHEPLVPVVRRVRKSLIQHFHGSLERVVGWFRDFGQGVEQVLYRDSDQMEQGTTHTSLVRNPAGLNVVLKRSLPLRPTVRNNMCRSGQIEWWDSRSFRSHPRRQCRVLVLIEISHPQNNSEFTKYYLTLHTTVLQLKSIKRVQHQKHR